MRLICGDSLIELAKLEADSVDSCVTDPPYMLGFMGKAFDHPEDNVAADVEFWKLVYRVLKPGAHLLAFGGTRTYHRMACAIEDAGFEIRDQIHWVYSQGFPKSLDVSKAIDKAAGAEREVVGRTVYADGKTRPKGWSNEEGSHEGYRRPSHQNYTPSMITAPATDAAKQWEGWGTALKPSHEPICVARKPLEKGLTVAQNVLKWGVGAINVDGCRVACDDKAKFPAGVVSETENNFGNGDGLYANRPRPADGSPQGRWPANFILTHSEGCELVGEKRVKGGNEAGGIRKTALGRMNDDAWQPKETRMPGYADADGKETVEDWICVDGCPIRELDSQAGVRTSGKIKAHHKGHGWTSSGSNDGWKRDAHKSYEQRERGYGDTGYVSRFFYCAKASKRDRNDGLQNGQTSSHPTVKPTALMQYLVRLVTPPGGTVLDPFLGSGSTAKAALIEGFDVIGIELEPEYVEIAKARCTGLQGKLI